MSAQGPPRELILGVKDGITSGLRTMNLTAM
jgi:hypothetical protein